MPNTRAKRAAEKGTVVNAAAPTTSSESLAVGQTIHASIRNVMLGGPRDNLQPTIYDVEIDGALFSREGDQDKARVEDERRQRWNRLMALLEDQPETKALAAECANDHAYSLINEHVEEIRQLGWILVTNGLVDIWRVIYLKWAKHDAYVLGDEKRFLYREPTGPTRPVYEQFGT